MAGQRQLDRLDAGQVADVVFGHGLAVARGAGPERRLDHAEQVAELLARDLGQALVVLLQDRLAERAPRKTRIKTWPSGARPGYFTLEKVPAMMGRSSACGTTNPKPSRGWRIAARR